MNFAAKNSSWMFSDKKNPGILWKNDVHKLFRLRSEKGRGICRIAKLIRCFDLRKERRRRIFDKSGNIFTEKKIEKIIWLAVETAKHENKRLVPFDELKNTFCNDVPSKNAKILVPAEITRLRAADAVKRENISRQRREFPLAEGNSSRTLATRIFRVALRTHEIINELFRRSRLCTTSDE